MGQKPPEGRFLSLGLVAEPRLWTGWAGRAARVKRPSHVGPQLPTWRTQEPPAPHLAPNGAWSIHARKTKTEGTLGWFVCLFCFPCLWKTTCQQLSPGFQEAFDHIPGLVHHPPLRSGIWGGIWWWLFFFFPFPLLKGSEEFLKTKDDEVSKVIYSVPLKNTPKPKMNARMTRYCTD